MSLRRPSGDVGAHTHEWTLVDDHTAFDYDDGRLHIFEQCRYADQRYVGTDDRGESYYETMAECMAQRRHTFQLTAIWAVIDEGALEHAHGTEMERLATSHRDDVPAEAAVIVADGPQAIAQEQVDGNLDVAELELTARAALLDGTASAALDSDPLAFAFTDGWSVTHNDQIVFIEHDGAWFGMEYQFEEKSVFNE